MATSPFDPDNILLSFPKGDPGPPGPRGPRGYPGSTGAPGGAGIAGPVGPIGPQGPQGEKGDKGDKGDPGTPGATGNEGRSAFDIAKENDINLVDELQWLTSLKGDPGIHGINGIDGVDGLPGPIGPQGIIGPPGLNGPPGSKWLTHAGIPDLTIGMLDDMLVDTLTGDVFHKTNTGWVPEVNIIGPQGIQGLEGPQGPQGIQGLQGIQGEIGPTGPEGLQGAQGIQGIPGTDGAEGPQGPIGLTGPEGPQGIQGLTGDTGAQGPQGLQGIQGIQGETGPQGFTGEDGTRWYISISGPINAHPDARTGDMHFTYSTGDVWENVGPTWNDWVLQGNLTGPQGIPGETGPAGPQGEPGVDGTNGTNGVDGTDGVDGERGESAVVPPNGSFEIDTPQGIAAAPLGWTSAQWGTFIETVPGVAGHGARSIHFMSGGEVTRSIQTGLFPAPRNSEGDAILSYKISCAVPFSSVVYFKTNHYRADGTLFTFNLHAFSGTNSLNLPTFSEGQDDLFIDTDTTMLSLEIYSEDPNADFYVDDIRVEPAPLVPGTWVTPALSGGWSNYLTTSFNTAGYRKIDSVRVELRGLIRNGALGVASAALTLPTEFHPVRDHVIIARAAGGLADIRIDRLGRIYVDGYAAGGTNAFVSLDNITFSID